ncbi:nucleoside-diphosphate sugar epimerase/dehydratase [Sphingomicrobium sp. XHP0239]|uniref:polysaccharide biosynthesis protein n=1 Tax=Sphingomicrobium maritimum TaxID=3133972 RepID=UPI0031CCBD72
MIRSLVSTISERAQSLPAILLNLPSVVRVAFVMVLDLILCVVAAALAHVLRIGEIYLDPNAFALTVALAVLTWFPLALWSGLYRGMARYFGSSGFEKLAFICFLQTVFLTFVYLLTAPIGVPRTLGVLQPLVLLALLVMSRVIISYGLLSHVQRGEEGTPQEAGLRRTLIVGVGAAARQIAVSMRYDPSLQLVGFIDPADALAGRQLENSSVWALRDIERVLESENIDSLFLANESLARADRRQLIARIQSVRPQVSIRILPSVRELADDRISLNDLKEIEIEDLLGRDEVRPLSNLIRPIEGTTVLVSGAGGSIGSQLCRQIVEAGPASLILAEVSEYALYRIEQELREESERQQVGTRLVPVLADLSRAEECERLFATHRPDRVFHAAAYKHVPLLEANVIRGAANNIRSTRYMVEAAERYRVDQFTLISTDKAVRPANVMGASKRVCELIVQARAVEAPDRRMCAVRFGNVLGSSGSVVPKFKRQIAAGGPVTVTHKDVMRYFMTIPEAASLVVQAGTMAEGGEVFLLEMGEAVRIADLAHTMIELTGLTVRNDANPGGDIEIVETGLRAGEKLYEELLIDADSIPTEHDRIVKAREEMIPWSRLAPSLAAFDEAFDRNDPDRVIALMEELVAGFEPQHRVGATAAA